MTYNDCFLLSVFYFLASSTSMSLGIGYYTIYRPVIAGLVTGLILKDPQTGMLAGAVVNIIYIDFASTGGSFKGDQCLTAIMAASLAIVLRVNPLEAAAVAFPFGLLGILIWKYRLKINNIFVHTYEKKYKEKKLPNISLYNGVFPQLLLYFMSSFVLLLAFFLMSLLNKWFDLSRFSEVFYYIGLVLVIFSVFNILYKIDNKYKYIIFLMAFIGALVFKVRGYFFFIVLAIILFVLIDKKSGLEKYKAKGIIRKRDLIYSWFIWKNFSHGAYSYERLMGLAFGHSMKNIFKRLYRDKNDISRAIHNHTEFFNTEPNMGTPIHGYIIALEEERKINNQSFESSNISYIKKAMMGIAAGLGDSYTQLVLAPLFVSMSVMLSLDKSFYLALVPIVILASLILYISYRGFMEGYFHGREAMLKRLKRVRESKIKVYFPYFFSGILGFSMGKLLFNNIYQRENIFTIVAIIIGCFLTYMRKRGQG